MRPADPRLPVRERLAAAVLAGGLQLAIALALVRAFAPGFPERMAESVMTAFTVATPRVEQVPPPEPAAHAPSPAGPAARKATPREVIAPPPRIVLAALPAPQIAGAGVADSSGASASGSGSGAGGPGAGSGTGGTGSGTGGTGAGFGGGQASRPLKIAGDIDAARDYPPDSRALRLGDYVILALTVGTDGRVRSCRVVRASRDAQADRVTCRLATERFRFQPARAASGAPVEAVFGWKQRWFRPGEG